MKLAAKGASALVYSTETGRMCPDCGQPVAQCVCRSAAPPPAGDGIVRVALDTKGRRGKGVTTVQGVPLAADALAALAKKLKAACGTGGTLKDGVIEIQGDHRDRLVPLLQASGFKVKRSGG